MATTTAFSMSRTAKMRWQFEDIAALEGLAVEQITGSWLANNPQYGSEPGMSLDETAGMMAWKEMTGLGEEPSSHWLLFERGYEYNTGRLIEEGTTGESELHPIYIGAYGEGSPPMHSGRHTDISSAEFQHRLPRHSNREEISGLSVAARSLSSTASRNRRNQCQLRQGPDDPRFQPFYDVRYEEPVDGSDIWLAGGNRISGTFATKVKGLLIEGNLYDHNGWAADYDYDRDAVWVS